MILHTKQQPGRREGGSKEFICFSYRNFVFHIEIAAAPSSAPRAFVGVENASGANLGFGRIVASGIEAPIILGNMV